MWTPLVPALRSGPLVCDGCGAGHHLAWTRAARALSRMLLLIRRLSAYLPALGPPLVGIPLELQVWLHSSSCWAEFCMF